MKLAKALLVAIAVMWLLFDFVSTVGRLTENNAATATYVYEQGGGLRNTVESL